jgi:ubiquinone/menaquinone biosynthesis C-methylase UbiE
MQSLGVSLVLRFLTNSLALSLGAIVGNQISLRVACHTQPRPMPHQVAVMLDHPWRLRYRQPSEEVGLYGVGVGLQTLDLGCGSGLYTLALAQRVGDAGLVHAVDLQQPLVDQARARVDAAGLSERVRFYCNGAYHLPLADASIDLALLIATLPQIPNKLLALSEVGRVLKPGGRLVISEELPDPAYAPPFVTCQWAEAAGFRLGGQQGSWFCYHQIWFNQPALPGS